MEKNQSVVSVWCILLGAGYPGLAVANRITLIGRALQHGGCVFQVCHLGANPIREVPLSGIYEGIPYRYYPANVTYARSRLRRKIFYILGMRQLLTDILAARRSNDRIVVYAWLGSSPASVWFRFRLRKLSIPIISEANEWFPGLWNQINRYMKMVQSDGLLVISSVIEKNFRRMFLGEGKNILKIPILADVQHETAEAMEENSKTNDSYVLWCGDAASSPKDIFFMLDVMANLVRRKCPIRLVIAGRTTEKWMREIEIFITAQRLPRETVEVTGYLSDEDLSTRMRNAYCLLLPLWADEARSVSRFPTKLAGYLATARPVITSPVGDVGSYLIGDKSAFLCPPGNVDAYANAIEMILRNPQVAKEVGIRGREVAEKNFDFRVHAQALKRFFDFPVTRNIHE